MNSSRTLLLVVTLLALTLPAMAQDAPSVPPVQLLASPACPGSAPTMPGVDTGGEAGVESPPIVPTIGGGGSCSGLSTCYCFCRFYHRCDLDPAECDPLAQCLNDCDAQYPGCPYPGGGYPSSIGECL